MRAVFMNSQAGVRHYPDRSPYGSANRLGHFLCAEQLWSSWAVGLSGVPRWIHQGHSGEARDIFVRRRRVAAIVEDPGEDAELRGKSNRRQVGLSEEARVDERMRDSRCHREQPIAQPVLTGHQRGMRGACQPLRQADDVFEPGFLGGDREGGRALNHVWIDGRAIIRALDAIECIRNALDIAHLGDRDLDPLHFQSRATAVFPAHDGADRIACVQ
jgi:hypothetical protein